MKTLLSSIDKLIYDWPQIKDAMSKITNNQTFEPINVEGLHGSFFSYFVSDLCKTAYIKNLQAIQYKNTSKLIWE
mgnify:FL=1